MPSSLVTRVLAMPAGIVQVLLVISTIQIAWAQQAQELSNSPIPPDDCTQPLLPTSFTALTQCTCSCPEDTAAPAAAPVDAVDCGLPATYAGLQQCNCTCPLGALAPAPAPMPLGFAPIFPQGAPSPGAAPRATAPLQPGTILLLLPPSYAASAALPGELSAPLQAWKARFMGIVPDYSLHAFDAVPLLPQLPSSLQYSSVQGNILAIMTAVPAKKSALDYATTVIGYPATYKTADIISSIINVPASFTAPTNLPNYTFTGLAAGAAVPAVPSGFSFLQMMPGVLVVLASGDERFLRSGSAPEPSPVAAPSSDAAVPQSIQALLSTTDIANLPKVPQGLQIILLPAETVLTGLPASSPVPASFQVPAALSKYNYILTSSGTQLPALPAGLSSATPTSGVTVIYPNAPAAAAPLPALLAPAPAPITALPDATILAFPADFPFGEPFALNAGGAVPAGFSAPAALAGYNFTQLPASSDLPNVPAGYSVLPVNAGLTAIVPANSSLVQDRTAASKISQLKSMLANSPQSLLSDLTQVQGAPAGAVVLQLPMGTSLDEIVAGNLSALPAPPVGLPSGVYAAESIQDGLSQIFPGSTFQGLFGNILAVAA